METKVKLLNARVQFYPGLPVYKAPPQACRFAIGSRLFLLDSNSLALWELDSNNEQVPLSTCKPQFPREVPEAQALCLEATTACNFACTYCFAREYADSRRMSTETAQLAVRTLMQQKPPAWVTWPAPQYVGYFGGEPLLNWELIRDFTPWVREYFRERGVGLSITTNGSLLTPERARFLADHGLSVIVSLDGPRHLHDELRKTRKGEGTYEMVVSGLKCLRNAGMACRVALRATFLPGREHLLERVAFLNNLCDAGLGGSVAVEPAVLTESHCHRDAKGFEPEQVRALEADYLRVSDYAIERINSGRPFRFKNINVMLQRLLWAQHNPSECGAGGAGGVTGCGAGYCSVDPQGRIGACHRINWGHIGSLDAGGIDEELRLPWLENRFYNSPECSRCGIRFLCGGGCREANYGAHGVLNKPYRVMCVFTQLFILAAINIMANVPLDTLKKVVPDPWEQAKRRCSKKQ